MRNLELTAPYMHDGRLETLEEVLEHYAENIKHSPTLANELKKNNQLGMQLTKEEQNLIIDFLKTLTDRDFTSNPIF